MKSGMPMSWSWVSLLFFCLSIGATANPIIVGSKEFTENVILGELITQLLQHSGVQAEHRVDLGGTAVLWAALLRGDIDVYPEYLGTLEKEIFSRREKQSDPFNLENELKKVGIGASKSMGFSNSYGIGLRRELALKLGISKISDLRRRPELRLVFSSGFMDRPDGWPGLRSSYRLPQMDVRGVLHSFSYRGLMSDAFDVTDVYTTDAEIEEYDILVLEDDEGFFPSYDALFLFRLDILRKNRSFNDLMKKLEGAISQEEMRRLNGAVIVQKKSEGQAASEFLKKQFSIETSVKIESPTSRILRQAFQHASMVFISMLAAICVAIPLGILAARRRSLGNIILFLTGMVQTLPSLALLVFMIPLFGIGTLPAIVALFLYSLLPIVRNTSTGLLSIPTPLLESAKVIGLRPVTILFSVKLPLASREILAGIKTACIINIGTATLGAIIGSGGFGEAILTGIRLNNIPLTLQGAIPAALMALVAQAGFELLDKTIIPQGLRLKPEAAKKL